MARMHHALLFSIYTEALMTEALGDNDEGIKVGGQFINEIRSVGDGAMMSDSEDGLQQLMNSLSTKAAVYNTRINTKKTKTM